MKLRELQEMIECDCDLSDHSALDQYSLNTAKLQSKYYVLYSNLRGELKSLEYEFDEVKLFKYKYYKGTASPEVYKEKPFHEKLTNSGIEAHINTDPDIQTLQKKMDMIDIKIELVNDMKKHLDQRNWQIRNTIEFMKFKNGI